MLLLNAARTWKLILGVVCTMILAGPALAQQRTPPTITNGTVTAFADGKLTILKSDGSMVTVELPERARISINTTASKDDLKVGMMVRGERGDDGMTLTILPERMAQMGFMQRPGGGGGQGRQGGQQGMRRGGQGRQGGQDGQRGGRGGPGGGRGGMMGTITSISPLTMETPNGQSRTLPADANLTVVRNAQASEDDLTKGAKVQITEIETPRGKMVLVAIHADN